MAGENVYEVIWTNRPDLGVKYREWGWNVTNHQAIVESWLGMTDDPQVIGAGRDATEYARRKGWTTSAPATVVTAPVGIVAATPAGEPTQTRSVLNWVEQNPVLAGVGVLGLVVVFFGMPKIFNQ